MELNTFSRSRLKVIELYIYLYHTPLCVVSSLQSYNIIQPNLVGESESMDPSLEGMVPLTWRLYNVILLLSFPVRLSVRLLLLQQLVSHATFFFLSI